MWKIIWSDLKYDKNYFITCYSLVVVLLLLLSFEREEDICRPLIMLTTMILFCTVAFSSLRKETEKRARIHVVLPVPVKNIGFVRLLPSIVIVVVTTFLIRLILTLFSFSIELEQCTRWLVIMCNSLIGFYATVSIGYDLASHLPDKYVKFEWLLTPPYIVLVLIYFVPLYTTDLIAVFGTFSILADFIRFLGSWPGIGSLVLMTAAFSWLSIYMFSWRSNFLHYGAPFLWTKRN